MCRHVDVTDFTTKQRYYYDKSYKRYCGTADGKYLENAVKKLTSSIGGVDGISFYPAST